MYLFYKYSFYREYWFLYDSSRNIVFFDVSFLIIDNKTGHKVSLVSNSSDKYDTIKVTKSKLAKFLREHSWELSSKETDNWFKPYIELSSEADKNSCYTPEEGSEYNIIGPHTNYACAPFNYPEPIEAPSNKVDLQDEEFEARMQVKFDRQKELYDCYKSSQKHYNYESSETHISDTVLNLAKSGGMSGVIAALGIATF